VRAVGNNRYDREQDGENRRQYPDLLAERIGFTFDFMMDFEFSHNQVNLF
jgi:hypothetical protein